LQVLLAGVQPLLASAAQNLLARFRTGADAAAPRPAGY